MAKTKKQSTLPQIVIAALSGLFTKAVTDNAKQNLEQGKTFEGELTIRVPYRLTKGINYDTAPTVNLLSRAVLAKALVYAGVTAPAYEKALLKAATEALEGTETVGDVIQGDDERVAKMILEIQERVVQRLPRQPRNGVVSVSVLTADGQPEIVKSEFAEVVK